MDKWLQIGLISKRFIGFVINLYKIGQLTAFFRKTDSIKLTRITNAKYTVVNGIVIEKMNTFGRQKIAQTGFVT